MTFHAAPRSPVNTESSRDTTPATSPTFGRAGGSVSAPSPLKQRRKPPRHGGAPSAGVGAINLEPPDPNLDLESPTPRGADGKPGFSSSSGPKLCGRRPGTPGSVSSQGTPSKGNARLAAFRPAHLQIPGRRRGNSLARQCCLGALLLGAGAVATFVAATAVAGPELIATRTAAFMDANAPTAFSSGARSAAARLSRYLAGELGGVGEALEPLPKGNSYGDDDDKAPAKGDDDDTPKAVDFFPDPAEPVPDEADWIGAGPHRYVKLYLANPSATGAATVVHMFDGGESVTARLGAREETYQYAQLGDTMEIRHGAYPPPAGEKQWKMSLELFAAPGTNAPALAFRNPMKGDAFSLEGQGVPGRWIGPAAAEAMTVNDGDRFWVKDLQLANRVGVALIYLEVTEQRMAHAMIFAENKGDDD